MTLNKSSIKKSICALLSLLLVWSTLCIPFAFAAGTGQTSTATFGSTVTVKLESDAASYAAGEVATFTVTIDNQSKQDLEDIVVKPSFSDDALNAAVQKQLKSINLGKLAKKKATTATFKVALPVDLPNVSTDLNVNVSTKKSGGADLSIPVAVTATLEGVAAVSASDAGTQLTGSSAQDVLKVKFGVANYDAAATNYSYALRVVGHVVAGDEGVDISDKLTAQWDTALPGAAADAMTGSGSIAAAASETAIVNLPFDAAGELSAYSAYDVSLAVKDTGGNETSKSVTLYRPRTNLDGVTWTFRDDTGRNKVMTKTGTAWFSTLYYENVAGDSRVPFHDAASLKSYLSSFATTGEAQAAFDKYIWDLLEPHLGVAGDYGDSALGWPKDGASPFHRQLSSAVDKMGTYIQSESGVTYDNDYFSELKKTAGPDQGDDNTDRTYQINLRAKTNPVATLPAVYVFMVPTHWQMFDELHATAQPGSSNATDGGSILTAVDQMAYLYDIKNALIRFTAFLKSEGNNAAVAVVNTQHGGDYSIVSSGGYFTTDMTSLEDALRGWDSFGDCEHVHWSTKTMSAAIGSLPTELSAWQDADGKPIDLKNVVKTVVAIGGPTENKGGDNGYLSVLDGTSGGKGGKDDKTAWGNIDYLYGIRTDTGTTQVNINGRDIYSWLDTEKNQAIIKAHNSFYTEMDDPNNPAYTVCTSEDAIYNQLMNIYRQSGTVSNTTKFGVVDNATISDTVTDEFDVKGVTATWTSVDGTKYTSKWTQDGTVVDPDDPSPDQITVKVNDDGTTSVSCNFGTLTGTGAVDVKIDAVAKADYFGSNNVKTNSGTPQISWSHTKKEAGKPGVATSYRKNFDEDPSVNVPLLQLSAGGGNDAGRVGTSFDLKDHASFDGGHLLDGTYDQLNGTLTLSWVEVDANGNEVAITDDASYKPVTYDVVKGSITGALELPSCTVKSDEAGTRNFKLKVTYTPENATNQMIPVSGRETSAPVELEWTDAMGLSILKVDADDQTPLSGVSFELRRDDGDDAFDETKDPLADVFLDSDCTQAAGGSISTGSNGKVLFYGLRPGTYWIKETGTIAGYQILGDALKLHLADDGKVYLTGSSGQAAEVTVTDNTAVISVANKKIPGIPSSGSSGRLLMQFVGVAVLIAAMVLVVKSRGKGFGSIFGK